MSRSRKSRKKLEEQRQHHEELEEQRQRLLKELEPQWGPLGDTIASLLIGTAPVLLTYFFDLLSHSDPGLLSRINLCDSSALVSSDFHLPAFTTIFATVMALSLTPWGQSLRATRALQEYNRSLNATGIFTILGTALSINYLITLGCEEIKKLQPTLPAEACFITLFTLFLFAFRQQDQRSFTERAESIIDNELLTRLRVEENAERENQSLAWETRIPPVGESDRNETPKQKKLIHLPYFTLVATPWAISTLLAPTTDLANPGYWAMTSMSIGLMLTTYSFSAGINKTTPIRPAGLTTRITRWLSILVAWVILSITGALQIYAIFIQASEVTAHQILRLVIYTIPTLAFILPTIHTKVRLPWTPWARRKIIQKYLVNMRERDAYWAKVDELEEITRSLRRIPPSRPARTTPPTKTGCDRDSRSRTLGKQFADGTHKGKPRCLRGDLRTAPSSTARWQKHGN